MVRKEAPRASEAERAEWEAVLRSPIFRRSPSILRVAEYIARTSLEGGAEDIKEYSIAVDALGKPVDFDPKRDSIVRVEVHRLRKKIDQFYRTEGACRSLRLVIDPGKYIPRFESAPAVEPDPAVTYEEPLDDRTLPNSVEVWLPERRSSRLAWKLFVPLGMGAAALFSLFLMRSWTVSAPEPIFLLAGTPAATVVEADAGFIMRGDRWFQGGSVRYPAPRLPIVPEAFETGQRVGNFDYNIPLAAIPWELRLYFGRRGGAGELRAQIGRGFDVKANGVHLLDSQEPDLGAALPENSMIRVFRDIVPGPDHLLHLSFRSGKEPAYVSAIGLSPGHSGSLLPIRLISKTAPWSDADGHTWSPDSEFVTGGKLKLVHKIEAGVLDRNLLTGERFGSFSYNIPVSKGTYRLKLYFVESWFGPDRGGGGGAGSRRFDVYAERQALLEDFDLFREFGHKPVVKEFHGLKTNSDGYINLKFVPRANRAEVNALELIEEPGRE